MLTYVQSMVGVRVGRDIPYTCRRCFAKLEKGSNAAKIFRATTEDARKSAGRSQHFAVVLKDAQCDRGAQTNDENSGSAQGI